MDQLGSAFYYLLQRMQSQERHLFLFSDVLLIGKARNGGNFKLKQSVRVSELWLTTSHIDDVAETNKSEETSFVLGWPSTNVVATFMTSAARDLWWGRLTQVIREETGTEPPDTNIQILYHESETNIKYIKTIMVSSEMTASTCVNLAARLLDLKGQFQLWSRTSLDDALYPLIGHERPFAIKLSSVRHMLSAEEGFDLEHCNKSGNDTCHFILRPKLKSPVKKNKSKITGLLRRSLSLNPSVFGVHLSRADDNGLPKPVLVMLHQIFAKGTFTQGIFRKSANIKIVRELRDQIEATGDSKCLESAPIIVIAALLKDFLRSLPDPLLTSYLFPQWMESLHTRKPVHTIKSILDRLPKPNYNLLSHMICVLHHIARRSKYNLMCASNLGVCCGPSLLWSVNPSLKHSRTIPTLTEMLIRNCEMLFGEGVTQLLGEERNDSGAEESTDSLFCEFDKSFYTIPIFLVKKNLSDADFCKLSIETLIRGIAAGGLSLDSLELTKPPHKDNISLSRDSGLTLSDCQLFIAESPIGSEESAVNTNSINIDKIIKDKKSINKTYLRVNGSWEENVNSYAVSNLQNTIDTFYDKGAHYSNPNFQRQDWIRAQLKRTPRTRVEENEDHKNHFVDKDIFAQEYQEIKENHKIKKELYRSSQVDISQNIQIDDERNYQSKDCRNRVLVRNPENHLVSTSLPTNRFELNKVNLSDYKKVKSEIYVNRETPVSLNSSHHSGYIYEVKKGRKEMHPNEEIPNNSYECDKSANIYANHTNSNNIYGTREREEIYAFKRSDLNNYDAENQHTNSIWFDVPPPLPPRLKHLPPVHMSFEDRYKCTGRSRILPPPSPPPYRPPPEPRAPIATMHIGRFRSANNDESYV